MFARFHRYIQPLGICLAALWLVGCKPAPSASISGEASAEGADGENHVTARPTILEASRDHSGRSPAAEERDSSPAYDSGYYGESPFRQDAEDPLPQAALPTTQGPPR